MNCIVSKFKGSNFSLPGKCSGCGRYGFVPDLEKIEGAPKADTVTYLCIDCSIKDIRKSIEQHPTDKADREVAIYEFTKMKKAGF